MNLQILYGTLLVVHNSRQLQQQKARGNEEEM